MKKQENAVGSATETKTANEEKEQSFSFKSSSSGDKKASTPMINLTVSEIYAQMKEDTIVENTTMVPKTPFVIMGIKNMKTNEKVYIQCLGTEAISNKTFATEEEAIENMEKPDWEKIFNLINMLVDIQLKKEEEGK